jgi:hypothetical protein
MHLFLRGHFANTSKPYYCKLDILHSYCLSNVQGPIKRVFLFLVLCLIGLGSCLDLELPGTGTKLRARKGKEEDEAGPGLPGGGESGSGNPAEMEET